MSCWDISHSLNSLKCFDFQRSATLIDLSTGEEFSLRSARPAVHSGDRTHISLSRTLITPETYTRTIKMTNGRLHLPQGFGRVPETAGKREMRTLAGRVRNPAALLDEGAPGVEP